MEVDINPITLDTTKLLAKLYPAAAAAAATATAAAQGTPDVGNTEREKDREHSDACILDSFFAADFLTPKQRHRGSQTDGESYGIQYVRYLHQFLSEQQRRDTSLNAPDGFVDRILTELRTRTRWDSSERENLLALAIIVQAHLEKQENAESRDAQEKRLAGDFAQSRLAGALWRSVQAHLLDTDGSSVRPDELEVAVELLFLFTHWARGARPQMHVLGQRAVHRVGLAVELFTRYARQAPRRRSTKGARQGGAPGAEVGRVQRIRLGHKALMLLDATWALLVGDEAEALRRLGNKPSEDGRGRQGMRRTGVARDALRHMRETADRYPSLSGSLQGDIDRLLPFVHPFDGHLTRTSQLPRFGPLRNPEHLALSPSTHMLLADMSPFVGPAAPPARNLPSEAPRAVRDAVAAYVGAARLDRSEREYAEWWRRLVCARGMPLSLTMNGARGSDVTVNYNSTASASAPAAAPRYSFCGIVEAEDLPALEAALDGRAGDVAWPVNTDPESDQQISSALYRALFPLLPQLSRALVRTIANWSPAERELGQRTGGVAGVQVSEATCLGIVAYPAWDEHITATAAAAVDGAASASPLGGSNVKRLSRAASSISVASTSAHAGSSASGHTLLAEVSARLLTQYAQWRTVGRLLMRMLLGLQANHVLQADYFAQLLMNENFIPAVFWWLGTADLTLCAALPLSVRTRCFTAEYARARAVSDAAADRTAVGADASDSGDLPEASNTTPLPCSAALSGLSDTLRSLRRLTSHNGLRKGLLYKNKALFFYTRLTLIPHLPIRRITAELLRDIMPVVSKKQKHSSLDLLAHVYLYAQPSLSDAFWLCDFALDPQIEMHRHVELLRLLHFYHHEQFALRLPKDPALFPSLVGQAVEGPAAADSPADSLQRNEQTTVLPTQPQKQQHSNHHHHHTTAAYSYPAKSPAKIHKKPTASSATTCARQSGAAVGEHSWLLWDSDLEDTLNEVYTPKT